MSLIRNIDEIKANLPVAFSNTSSRLPSIVAAEQQYLLPILGQALYDVLDGAYASPNPTQTALIKKCQAVIAPFAYLVDLPFMQAMLTDAGAQVLETDQTRKAFKWEFNNLVEGLQQRGYAAQEVLLLHLHANATSFPAWDSSDYRTNGFQIIRNGNDLRGLLGLQQPHRCYLILKPLFNTLAELYIKPAIGYEYYDALSGRIKAGNTNEDDDQILPKLRMCVAHKVMVKAAQELNVQFNGTSFTIVAQQRDTPDEGRATASEKHLAAMIERMDQAAEHLMRQVRKYMDDHASETVFPEYFASGLWRDPEESSPRPNNTNFRGIFVANR